MENKVTLELTVNDLNVILAGLSKLPIEAALQTFDEVRNQAQQQLGQSTQPEGPLADKVV